MRPRGARSGVGSIVQRTVLVVLPYVIWGSPRSARAQRAVAAPACGVCADYGSAHLLATVHVPALQEASGLAASHVHPDVFYTHNDSGDVARVFAIDAQGALRAELVLQGAPAVDWEDIASGPCSGRACVVVGDIGDNDRNRTNYSLYRFTEPAVLSGGRSAVPFETFPFTYPDGPHDAEALVLDPRNGDAYVITKEFGIGHVFQIALSSTRPNVRTTATHAADVQIHTGLARLITGADAHPCEPRVVIRTYDRAFELRGAPGATLGQIFAAPWTDVPLAFERQGEAIAYTANGRGYVTTSEGDSPPLHVVTCR